VCFINCFLLHQVHLLNQTLHLQVLSCPEKGREVLLKHAHLAKVHEVEDEEEMVVVHAPQEDKGMWVVEVAEHAKEETGAGGEDELVHLHLGAFHHKS